MVSGPLTPGQTLYLKKGAEIIHQYFDDEYCMLGFFISDELIKETFDDLKSKMALNPPKDPIELTAFEVPPTNFLEGFFHSMLNYFRGIDRPPDQILVFKLKELLITLMNSDPTLTAYFKSICECDKPPLRQIMEKNFCFNLKLETICRPSSS